jgi:hypothetical protein
MNWRLRGPGILGALLDAGAWLARAAARSLGEIAADG